MTDTGPVIVAAPAEIDISNAGGIAKQLRSALAPGVPAVVVDLTVTTFCDSSGLRVLVLAYDWATADGIALRLAAPPGATRDVLQIMGLDRLLPLYPSLAAAAAGKAVTGSAMVPGKHSGGRSPSRPGAHGSAPHLAGQPRLAATDAVPGISAAPGR